MRLLALHGYWYTDARSDGAYVAAPFGRGGVLTESGTVEGPALQWVRIGPDGLCYAGTGANDGNAWEWDGTDWHNRGAFVAPRAVIYQADGSLKVEREGAWPGPGSQGWRYADDAGNLIPAWSTYADGARQIYEYTTRRDVTIGQGNGGVDALVAGKRIRLDHLFRNPDGSLRFGTEPLSYAVNFNRDGDYYAVSWYVAHSPVSYTACIVWISDAELRALPNVDAAPTPESPPVPVPQPTPEPVPMPDISRFLINRTTVVHSVKADFPHLKGGEIVDQVAHRLNREHGVRVFGRKARNADGSNPNDDILAIQRDPADFSKKAMVDILIDGGGRDEPTWQLIPEHEEAGNGFWRAPVAADLDGAPLPIPEPQPNPEPQPIPPPVPSGVFGEMLAELRKINATLDRHFR